MWARVFALIAVLALAIGLLWVARQRRRPASVRPPHPTATPYGCGGAAVTHRGPDPEP